MLSREREEYIGQLAGKLKEKYSTDYGINFQQLADDHNIGLIETDETGGGLAVSMDGQHYVLARKSYLIPSMRGFELSHEFGHVLLGHFDPGESRSIFTEEAEAMRFAERLTGRSVAQDILLCIPETVFRLLTDPVAMVTFTSSSIVGRYTGKAIDEFESARRK